jgi:hypothetical protein
MYIPIFDPARPLPLYLTRYHAGYYADSNVTAGTNGVYALGPYSAAFTSS